MQYVHCTQHIHAHVCLHTFQAKGMLSSNSLRNIQSRDHLGCTHLQTVQSTLTFKKHSQKVFCSLPHQPNQLSLKQRFNCALWCSQAAMDWDLISSILCFSSSVRPNNFLSIKLMSCICVRRAVKRTRAINGIAGK